MTESLILELENKDPKVRMKAAVALGNSGDKEAIHPLTKALKDQNRHVRRAATAALAQVWNREMVVPLCAALSDSD